MIRFEPTPVLKDTLASPVAVRPEDATVIESEPPTVAFLDWSTVNDGTPVIVVVGRATAPLVPAIVVWPDVGLASVNASELPGLI